MLCETGLFSSGENCRHYPRIALAVQYGDNNHWVFIRRVSNEEFSYDLKSQWT